MSKYTKIWVRYVDKELLLEIQLPITVDMLITFVENRIAYENICGYLIFPCRRLLLKCGELITDNVIGEGEIIECQSKQQK